MRYLRHRQLCLINDQPSAGVLLDKAAAADHRKRVAGRQWLPALCETNEEPAPSRHRLFVHNAVLIPDELLVWLVRPPPSMARHHRRSPLEGIYGDVTLAAHVRMPACSTVLIRLTAFSEAAVSFMQRR